MDPKLIIPGVLLIGGAIFFLQPDKTAKPETHEAVVNVPKSQNERLTDAIVAGSIAGPVMAGRGEKPYDGTNPEVLRRKELAGFVYRSPALVKADGNFGIVSKVISGITPDSPAGMPSALMAIAAPVDCQFAKPAPGDQVAGVHTYSGGPVTNAHAYSDATVAKAALRGLREHKGRHGRDVTDNASIVHMPGTALRQIDVVINKPGAPVFLTLQDRGGGILWNLQPLPGTVLSHVTLLSGGSSAVANLPDGVGLLGASLSGEGSCSRGAYPVEPPPPETGKRAGYTITSRDARMQDLRDSNGFGAWFKRTFGYETADNMVRAGGMAHVIVGDLPAEDAPAVPYRPLQGAALHVIPAALTYVASPAEHEAWLRARAVQMLAAAYGVTPETDLGAIIRSASEERIR